MKAFLFFCVCLSIGTLVVQAQPAASRLSPNLESNIERPLRYRPDGADFVIENGAEFFNRPLYGGNTAFRVDGGDKPEFVLYLPGRGGNLRLAVRKVERTDPSAFSSHQRTEVSALHHKWLHDAKSIVTRYRPGQLLYEIRDPLLGANGVLKVSALAYHQTEGLIVRVEASGVAPGLELVWAYGGVNGQRGQRDGDIGTERVPIREWFQLKPDFSQGNTIEIHDDFFHVVATPAVIRGQMPVGSRLSVGDAANWNDLDALLGSAGSAKLERNVPDSHRESRDTQPVLVGRVAVASGHPLLLSLQVAGADGRRHEANATYREVGAPDERAPARARVAPGYTAAELPRLFAETERHFAQLREQVLVVTPDPFINAAVGALNVAADAVWDGPQEGVMHGAIAWRTRLLGWRGPYAFDALGWHDRARKHFEYWPTRQNLSPIPDKFPPPEEETNLARSRTALHSNGNLSNNHYDMNLVFFDAFFRHLRWTGDIEFAKKMWPTLERHLAWERRLFRREFTTASGEKLPLYEAYAAIWASDDLQYSGGGSAHGSAYNFWHNKMAAQIAPLVGADPAIYAKEAELIARGMRELLWQKETGMFAETKDWLGKQLVHPDAALWSFYHVMDAELVTQLEADWMVNYVDNNLPHIPVNGPGVPDGLVTLGTSNWMPYSWSLNNVTMNENAHGALGLWQAGASHAAFSVFKGSLVAAMFMGISPGNVGSMSYLDVYRRESQRDFADGSGTLSRALVEGLFGVRPDLLAGELLIAPGFPADWNRASLKHPSLQLSFLREGSTDTYSVESHFSRPVKLRLQIRALGTTPRVVVNGQAAEGTLLAGEPTRFEIVIPPAPSTEIKVTWSGRPLDQILAPPYLPDQKPPARVSVRAATHSEPVNLTSHFNDRVMDIFQKGKYRSPRSPFVSLAMPAQGLGYWAGHVNATAEIDDTGLRATTAKNDGKLALSNGITFATSGPGDAKNILFTSQWDNYPREATVALAGKARRVHLLMAGSTNAMQSRLDNGEVIATYADGTSARLALRNPETWWPIEQDYFIDDFQFRVDGPLPTRINLKTGEVRVLERATFKGKGREIPGGAATVLSLDLDETKELQSLTVRALANDVVIGLMAATLER